MNAIVLTRAQRALAAVESGQRVSVSLELAPGLVTDGAAYIDPKDGLLTVSGEVQSTEFGSYTATFKAKDREGARKLLQAAIEAETPIKVLRWLQGKFGRTPILRRSLGGPFRALKKGGEP